MIRSALIALGLSAGAAQGQGVVPTAPLVETCGGTHLVLEAVSEGVPKDLTQAVGVVNNRVLALAGAGYDFAEFDPDRDAIDLFVPAGLDADFAAVKRVLEIADFAIYSVTQTWDAGVTGDVPDGQFVLGGRARPEVRFVLATPEILDGHGIGSAAVQSGASGTFDVGFQFSPQGRQAFGQYTSENVGTSIAFVVNSEVISTPVIQAPIFGSQGIISAGFTQSEAAQLAAVLEGGVLPFDLIFVFEETLNGSDPSADFCP